MENSGTSKLSPDSAGESSFAVLGQNMTRHAEHETQMDTRPGTHPTAKKVCAVLRVMSSIVNALAVHPGADSTEEELEQVTMELMSRAQRLTESCLAMLQLNPAGRQPASYKSILKQQAMEFVSCQWRMEHAAGSKGLTVEQVELLCSKLLNTKLLDDEAELNSYPADVDPVSAKRTSLFAIVPEIYQAVNGFDYFNPDPSSLVERGVLCVIRVADDGMKKIVSSTVAPETVLMVTQSVIGKLGALYAANYRAHARKDVTQLQKMDEDERFVHLNAFRTTGLPTGHIDLAFEKFAHRMLAMVCEAVPELSQVAAAAPQASTVVGVASDQSIQPS